MQRVKIYNDLLHLAGEWMNADMLNRGTEDRHPPPPLSLSLSLSLSLLGEGANVPSTLWIRHWKLIEIQPNHDKGNINKILQDKTSW